MRCDVARPAAVRDGARTCACVRARVCVCVHACTYVHLYISQETRARARIREGDEYAYLNSRGLIE